MDEAVLLAMACAAMLPEDSSAKLSQDLEKIEVMTARAASSSAAETESGNASAEEFSGIMGFSEDGKTGLRCDKAEKHADESIISQSKRFEGSYTSVPRIV